MKKPQSRTPLEALTAAVGCFETQEAFGSAIGKSQGYVSMLLFRMKNKGMKVPLDICPQVEAASNGRVTRRELRPDFPWDMPASVPAQSQAVA